MRSLKPESRNRRPKSRLQNHKRSVVLISLIIFLLGAVIFAQGMSLRERNKAYKAQEAELMAQLDEEKERSEEIDQLKEYVGTDEYIEDVAREKLGLVHENEILFRAEQ
ncbi:septum formation initiator family protein [Roseburia hominis]